MMLSRRMSKLVLVSHVIFSIGWLGAVAVFLALAITGLNSQNDQLVRACLLAMKISAWFVILPFCLTALATGIVQAAWTKWGLVRYYWVAAKLFLTLASTLLLLLHLQPINTLAEAALQPTFTNVEHSSQSIDLIAKSGSAILVLLLITSISIFKPWGKIQIDGGVRSWLLIGIVVVVFLAFIVMHLFGGAMHRH